MVVGNKETAISFFSETKRWPVRIKAFKPMHRTLLHIILMAQLLLGLMPMSYAQRGYTVRYEPTNKGGRISFELQQWRLREVHPNGISYQTIDMPSALLTERKGWAELPYVSECIAVADDAHVSARLLSADYHDIDLQHPMLPSRGTIFRHQHPDSIPYTVDPEALHCSRYPEAEHSIDSPFVMRDVRGVRLCFYPFVYNAQQRKLRVYSNITLELVEERSPRAANTLKRRARVQQGGPMYGRMFLNYAQPTTRAPLPVAREYGDILVVTTARDTAGIAPYIEWKRQKGFQVERLVLERGANVEKAVRTAYEANPNIMFVQLVGDWEDLKTTLRAKAPSDPAVGCVAGSDNFPDIAVGRFSCSSAAELKVQVDKSIAYERDPDLSAQNGWYASAISIASNEGGYSSDNGESDSKHLDNIWEYKLQPDGFKTRHRIHQGQDQAQAANVTAAIEDGASLMNYAGHGYIGSFVTTGYSYSNVATLNNGHKLPIIIATACLVGSYDRNNCFAEAWMRRSGGGAVAAFMSTIEQPWNPPMRGQDYFNDIITGGYNYDHNPGSGINTEERRTLLGNVHINGLSLMLKDYSSARAVETAQTWILFGDAALQIRTAPPKSLVSSDMQAQHGIDFTTTLTVDGLPASGIQVCLSQKGRYVSGFTDADGRISLPTSDFEVGKALLVATGFNTSTIYQEIDMVPIHGPYVRLKALNLDNDGQLLVGRDAQLQLQLQNIGQQTSLAGTVRLSCAHPMVQIDGELALAPMAPGEERTVDGFVLRTDPAMPDGQQLSIAMEVATTDYTWANNQPLIAHRPVLGYRRASWNERLGVDAQILVSLDVINTGSYEATDVQVELTTASPLVSAILPQQVNIDRIGPNGDVGRATFAVDIAPGATSDDAIPFNVLIKPSQAVDSSHGSFVLSNACNVEFTLMGNAQYKDGWHGNMLRITGGNGLDTSITVLDGYSQSHVLALPIGTAICVEYMAVGRYPEEKSFRVAYVGGAQIAKVDKALGSVVRFVCHCSCSEPLPSTPTGLSVAAQHNPDTDTYTMNLTWNAVPSALCYSVYRNNELLASSLADTVYADMGLLPGETYTYTVAALTCMGESSHTAPVSVNTKECRAPTNLSYTYRYLNATGKHWVVLTWKSSSMPGMRYALYRNDTLLTNELNKAKFEDATAYAGLLRYRVQALCDGLSSPMSDEVELQLRSCEPPRNLQASVEHQEHPVVKLTWDAAPLQVFRVLRDDNEVIAQGFTEPMFVDTAVRIGRSYRYKIKAICGIVGSTVIDDNSLSLASNTVEIEVTEPTDTIDEPTDPPLDPQHLLHHAIAALRVYPNPVRNSLWLEADEQLVRVKLYSTMGICLREHSQSPTRRAAIDVSGLPQGLYLLKAYTKDGRCGCLRVVVE